MEMPSTKKAASKAFNGSHKGKSNLGCERCIGQSEGKASKQTKTMRLSDGQRKMLKKHSAHHSAKHMKMMTDLMLKGASFDEAHEMTQDEVGD